MSKFTPTPAEAELIKHVFAQADPQKLGVVTGDAAVKIFSTSGLPPSVLAEIWNVADEENNGVLTRKSMGIALRLLGHAQRGEKVSETLVNKPGPLPKLDGISMPSNVGIPPAKSPPPGFPPLTPEDKSKFLGLFMGCNPVNGLLSGEKARDVFVKSKLPVEKLSLIWNLADTKKRGVLDATDFTIAMYLIRATMSGQLQAIPPSLPPAIIEQAANGVIPQATGGSGHMSPALTGGFSNRPVQPQYTGQALSQIQPQMTGQALSSLQPQVTGTLRSSPAAPPLPARSAMSTVSSPAFPFVQQQNTGAQWDISPQEKAGSDRLFDGLDTQKKGYIEGEIAVPFMLQSNLPEEVLAAVWDLSDLNNDGRLTRDGFAVALHLIKDKLAGKDIPSTLPSSLVPPSMRGSVLSQPTQPAVPEAMRDLLWDESPPASATVTSFPSSVLQPQSTGILQPQSTGVLQHQSTSIASMTNIRPATVSPPPRSHPVPAADPFANGPFGSSSSPAPKDFLSDDDEPHTSTPRLHDQSAEIGNVKNQLNSTNRSLETAKNERATIERQLTEQAALLSSLQTQLASSKAAYDTESKLLGTLKERFAAQSADIQKTREELIHSESDLSAAKVERAEVEGALLRDKEDVRDLQRKMHDVGAQIEATKAELEKFRKEAKQQKGLLAIARKQLATRESEKAKVDKELEEAKAELQEVTKEREGIEAELSKEDVPAVTTNGYISPVSTPDSALAYAAAQPLPISLPTSPDVSPPATRSTNPFERLAMSSSPRPESPFLPFAASPIVSSPLSTTPAASITNEPVNEDPFGLNDAFSAPEEQPNVDVSVPVTPKPSMPPPISIGSPQQHELVSPAESDMFTTPPSTAIPDQLVTPPRGDSTATRFPALDDVTTEETTPTPTGPPDATSSGFLDHHEETDLTHELKEVEASDSDSSSEDEDDEPLGTIKAKLDQNQTNGNVATLSGSAFDDSFGISNVKVPKQASPQTAMAPATTPNDFTSIFETPAGSKEAPPSHAIPAVVETPKPNGSALAPSAGVSEFDQALGKLSSAEGSAPASQFTDFGGFDSAFDDNFDFAAASVAQPSQPVATAPAASPLFPPAPTAAVAKSNGFDDVFGTSSANTAAPTAASVPGQFPSIPTFPVPVPAPAQTSSHLSQPISFDDAFGATPAAGAQNLAASTSTQSNGTIGGLSFDDAFGGNEDPLALDTSFTSQTSQASSYQPPPGPPPGKAGQQPFPTASTPSSPRGSSSTQPGGRRSLSPTNHHTPPPPRQASPPPRHTSPRPRPSTAETKEKAATTTRHNRLSIRLPFGRKKKQHDAPPVPLLAQQQIVEDPTPAVEDDVEAVKTLCGMGFSRTQAVTALEEHGYDVQRALNSLLGTQ